MNNITRAYLDDEAIREQIGYHINELQRFGLFSILLEASHGKAQLSQTEYQNSSGPEIAALNNMYKEGYYACITDLFSLKNVTSTVNKSQSQEQIKPTFGGLDALLESKQITQKEYELLKQGVDE